MAYDLVAMLKNFLSRTRGNVEAAVLLDGDARPLAFAGPEAEAKAVALVSRILSAAVRRGGEVLGGGRCRMSIINYENVSVLIYPMADLHLVALMSHSASWW